MNALRMVIFRSAIAVIFSAGGHGGVSAQEPQRLIGLSLSQLGSSRSLGFHGRWSNNDDTWYVSGFGTGISVERVKGENSWLLESLLVRSGASSGLGQFLLASVGFRLTDYAQGGTEVAIIGLVGARVPLLRGDSWGVSIEGHVGLARRVISSATKTARAGRLRLALDWGSIVVSLEHDDAAGSDSPFIYGGAARLGLGWRFD
jgi:hypothetical protein